MKTIIFQTALSSITELVQTEACKHLKLNFKVQAFGLIRFAETIDQAWDLLDELLEDVGEVELPAEFLESEVELEEVA